MPTLPWEDFGAGALLALVVGLILFGLLIPKRTHDRELKHKDDEIVELRRSLSSKESTISELMQQNSALIEAARTGTSVAESIQRLLDQEATQW